MFSVLTPRKSGLTFIIPESEIIDDIYKLAHGDNPEKAVTMIRTLCLPKYYKDFAAFDANKTKLTTLAGFQLDVENISPDSITLSNGSKLKSESKFHPFESRSNIAIYNMSGSIPTTGTAVPKKEKAGVSGGFDYSDKKKKKIRFIASLEAQYRAGISSGVNPYLDAVVSLLDYLEDDKAMQNAAVVLLDYDPIVSFYILVNFPELISDDDIDSWIDNYSKIFKPRTAYIAYIDSIKNRGLTLSSEESRAKIRDHIKQFRGSQLGNPVTKSTFPSKIREQAEKWASSNSVEDVNDVFPPALASIYSSKPSIKFLHDEFRNVASALMAGAKTPADISEALVEISLYLVGTRKGLQTLFSDAAKYSIGNELLYASAQFVCTTDYFYIPALSIEISNLDGADSGTDPSKGLVYVNGFKGKYDALKQFTDSEINKHMLRLNLARTGRWADAQSE